MNVDLFGPKKEMTREECQANGIHYCEKSGRSTRPNSVQRQDT